MQLSSDMQLYGPATKVHRYFSAVDIIRFFSAVAVLAFHFCYISEAADFTLLWPATWFGWIGVEIFFVISGFVIANSANGSGPVTFLKGRILRLYPAVWLCATITFAVSAADLPISFYLRSIALFPKGPWVSSVYWTLQVEIAFYALVFVLLWFNAFAQISRVALALTLCSTFYLVIVALKFPISEHMNVFLLRHGCFFALGIWIWLATTRPLYFYERVAVIWSFLPCILEIWLSGTQFLPSQIMGQFWILMPVMFWCAAIACIWASSKIDNPFASNTAAFVRTLGLMTYPLYLVHDEVGHRLIETVISIGMNKWVALVFGALSMIFLSWIACSFWEPPVRALLRKAFDKIAVRFAGLTKNA